MAPRWPGVWESRSRTWYNYEGGVTVPAEVIFKIIELTSVEAGWLLHGQGPKFRNARPERSLSGATSSVTIGALLRTALQLLEKNDTGRTSSRDGHDGVEQPGRPDEDGEAGGAHSEGPALHDLELAGSSDDDGSAVATEEGLRLLNSRREWISAQRDNRCMLVSGDSMAPDRGRRRIGRLRQE